MSAMPWPDRPTGEAATPDRRTTRPGTLQKGVALLSAMNTGAQSLTQLSRKTGLAKSTAHRILAMLCEEGLARRVGNLYAQGATFEVTFQAGRGLFPGGRRAVLPHLIRLYGRTRQTVNVAVSTGAEVQYIERIYGENRITSPSDGIDRAPLHCTAAGKVLLAFGNRDDGPPPESPEMPRHTRRTITRLSVLMHELNIVRNRGVAFSVEEFSEGLSCVAAPVLSGDRDLKMAIGVAGPADSMKLPLVATETIRTAQAISRYVRS